MTLRSRRLLRLNSFFRPPVHPFNLAQAGLKTYAEWQYERGADTLAFYLDCCTAEEIIGGKTVLDIGCGAAGKSLFYAANGAAKVYGLELLEKYRAEAERLARSLGLADSFVFVTGDSAALPFPDSFADTVIVNDAMEHVAEPEKTLLEILRVLKPGGRAFINFPPYFHPSGAHLTDLIYIPWVQCLFPQKILIEAYEDRCRFVPDGAERIAFRVSQRENGGKYFSYINKMTIRRFNKILKKIAASPIYYRRVPLRSFIAPLTRLPVLREFFVKMVVCVLEKP